MARFGFGEMVREMSGDVYDIDRPGIIAFGEGLPSESSLAALCASETVVQMSSWLDHAALVCVSGRAYTMGFNPHHSWMPLDAPSAPSSPTLVPGLEGVKITHSACGWGTTFLLADDGVLYACGLNDHGQLGLGHTHDTHTPVKVRGGLPAVKRVFAGWRHVVTLTAAGQLWVCGDNANGQLGLRDVTTPQTTFVRAQSVVPRIAQVACGSEDTALVSTTRGLLMTGSNVPSKWSAGGEGGAKAKTAIGQVACGYAHTVVLAKDGTVWTWGGNDAGQLGMGNTTSQESVANKVPGMEKHKITNVFAGCNHTAALTNKGDVFVWGRGQSGELVKKKGNVFIPTLLCKKPGLHVQQVEFGWRYTLLLVAPELGSVSSVLQPSAAIPTINRKTLFHNLAKHRKKNK